uniref:NS1 n=1 Tax=Grass carp reovirus TaxID=128987 RepID=M1T767_GCRV|nr:NS1 [Grass carp reovirus]
MAMRPSSVGSRSFRYQYMNSPTHGKSQRSLPKLNLSDTQLIRDVPKMLTSGSQTSKITLTLGDKQFSDVLLPSRQKWNDHTDLLSRYISMRADGTERDVHSFQELVHLISTKMKQDGFDWSSNIPEFADYVSTLTSNEPQPLDTISLTSSFAQLPSESPAQSVIVSERSYRPTRQRAAEVRREPQSDTSDSDSRCPPGREPPYGKGRMDPETYNIERKAYLLGDPYAVPPHENSSAYFAAFCLTQLRAHATGFFSNSAAGTLLATRDEQLILLSPLYSAVEHSESGESFYHIYDRVKHASDPLATFTILYVDQLLSGTTNSEPLLRAIDGKLLINITPTALVWLCEHNLSDGLMSCQARRIILGVDHLMSRLDSTAALLACLLMDHKLSFLRHAPLMVFRFLMTELTSTHRVAMLKSFIAHAARLPNLHAFYGPDRFTRLIDFMSISAPAAPDPTPLHDAESHLAEIQKLMAGIKLQTSSCDAAIRDIQLSRSMFETALATLRDRSSASANLDTSLLDTYLKEHTCINVKEGPLLLTLGIANDKVNGMLASRHARLDEFKALCSSKSGNADATMALKAQIDELRTANEHLTAGNVSTIGELALAHKEITSKDETIAALRDEMRALETRVTALTAEHEMDQHTIARLSSLAKLEHSPNYSHHRPPPPTFSDLTAQMSGASAATTQSERSLMSASCIGASAANLDKVSINDLFYDSGH